MTQIAWDDYEGDRCIVTIGRRACEMRGFVLDPGDIGIIEVNDREAVAFDEQHGRSLMEGLRQELSRVR